MKYTIVNEIQLLDVESFSFFVFFKIFLTISQENFSDSRVYRAKKKSVKYRAVAVWMIVCTY